MIKKVLRKLERLKRDKAKLVTEQSDLQKKIDDIDIEIKNYTNLKREYDRLEKKFNDLTNSTEVKNNE
ncbi:hypothetical protein [uncultured Clostridium sp.]|uniref:hypothetical protein n=1 Tax=uncultured Clostridium sp. TaxID=59620 RepID=UPI002615A2AA|nr:hypothetical protein [uncultured Clostridium sp.]MCI8310156.1 hypothetical protein [Clostridia bacterium]